MFELERPHRKRLPAVAQAIAAGEPWLLAWTLQSTTPWHLLSSESGIPERRLDDLYRGADVSRTELVALARVWKVDVDQIVSTLPAGRFAEE
jgi:hypothetical protein